MNWGPMGSDDWKGGNAPWNKDMPWQDNRMFRGWGPVPQARQGVVRPPVQRPPAPAAKPQAAPAAPAAPAAK